jgi:hypothetical protein
MINFRFRSEGPQTCFAATAMRLESVSLPASTRMSRSAKETFTLGAASTTIEAAEALAG